MCLNILRTHWRLFVPFSPSNMLHPVKRLKELFSPNTKKKIPSTDIPTPKKANKPHSKSNTANQTQLPPPTSTPRKHINIYKHHKLPPNPTEQRGTWPMLYLELHHVSGIFAQRFQVENFATRQQQALLGDGVKVECFLSMDVCVWQYKGLKKLQGRPIRNKRPNAINAR